MIHVLIFTEGSFEKAVSQPSLEVARAYASGVQDGAALYGAGSCGAYVFRDDADEMRESESAEEVARAERAIAPKAVG